MQSSLWQYWNDAHNCTSHSSNKRIKINNMHSRCYFLWTDLALTWLQRPWFDLVLQGWHDNLVPANVKNACFVAWIDTRHARFVCNTSPLTFKPIKHGAFPESQKVIHQGQLSKEAKPTVTSDSTHPTTSRRCCWTCRPMYSRSIIIIIITTTTIPPVWKPKLLRTSYSIPRVDPTRELRVHYACQSPIIPDPRCTYTLDGRIEGQEYQKCEPESTMRCVYLLLCKGTL